MATSVTKKKVLVKKFKNENEIQEAYCRVCVAMKPIKEFYTKCDDTLDKNGFMSVCKFHCNEIYTNSLNIERNFEKALFRTCKILNVAWVPNCVDATKTQVVKAQDAKKEDIQVFGIYKSKLSTLSNLSGDGVLTFDGYVNNGQVVPQNQITDDKDFDKYLKDFWGPDLPYVDYEFLESELARYEETHKSDTASEKSLLRQICFAELDLRKARMNGGTPSAKQIETLQNLMKTASIDPSKASLANTAKNKSLISSLISIIEDNEPAEYYENKKLFKDFDGLDAYFKKHMTRPTKNFILQSRDFNTEAENDNDDFDYEGTENGDITQTL
jgi:hypothetical protein